jgi:hypothetical protein
VPPVSATAVAGIAIANAAASRKALRGALVTLVRALSGAYEVS